MICKIGIACSMLFTLTSCPDDSERDLTLYFVNNSEEKLVFFQEVKAIGRTSSIFDTTLWEDFPWGDIQSLEKDTNWVVNSYTTGFRNYYPDHLQDALNRGYIHTFIFNYDSLVTIPWERIRDEYIVAKRVDFDTWEELEAADFTVTYP